MSSIIDTDMLELLAQHAAVYHSMLLLFYIFVKLYRNLEQRVCLVHYYCVICMHLTLQFMHKIELLSLTSSNWVINWYGAINYGRI